MFTFDDGRAAVFSEAMPYMASKGLVGTAYIVQNRIGTPGYMTEAQLIAINAAGWDAGDHTVDHTQLTTLTEPQQKAEIEGCANYEIGLGLTGSGHVAYPGGYENADTLTAMAEVGALTGRGTVAGSFWVPVANKYLLKATEIAYDMTPEQVEALMDAAQLNNQVQIFFLHDLVDASPVAYQWLTSSFRAVIDYAVSKGYPVTNMSGLYPKL